MIVVLAGFPIALLFAWILERRAAAKGTPDGSSRPDAC